MCDFISYIEKSDKKVLFLTNHLIYHTAKGKLLQKQASKEDLCGHGAIRFYFGLESGEGKERECTDFSDSKNFPDAIVKAIKKGEMRGLAQTPPAEMLAPKARAEYRKVVDPAKAEYRKVVAAAEAEYRKVVAAASAEYGKVVAAARAEYHKVVDKTFWDLFMDNRNRAHSWGD